jgi:hypothetical protein
MGRLSLDGEDGRHGAVEYWPHVLVLLSLLLLLLGLYGIERLTHAGQPLRSGPWPGLTPRGAAVVLLHALLLGALLLLLPAVGLSLEPATQIAYLALASALSVAVLVLAESILRVPGVGVAVCAVCLLPLTLLSLALPAVSPPLELVAPATIFDLMLWVRPSDARALLDVWPRRSARRVWRRRDTRPRIVTPARAARAGASFGLVLALLAPPSARLLGVASGSPDPVLLVVTLVVAAGVSALTGFGVALTLARRRTGS